MNKENLTPETEVDLSPPRSFNSPEYKLIRQKQRLPFGEITIESSHSVCNPIYRKLDIPFKTNNNKLTQKIECVKQEPENAKIAVKPAGDAITQT